MTQRTQGHLTYTYGRGQCTGYRWKARWRGNIGRGPEESQMQEHLSPWGWGAPPSWHMGVLLPTLKLPCTSSFRRFHGGLSIRCDQLLTQSLAPLPLPERWEVRLKVPSSWSRLSLSGNQPSSWSCGNRGMCCLIRTNLPIAPKVPRILGARSKDNGHNQRCSIIPSLRKLQGF